jgi:uncharacterized phage protein (TIGR01671 family)
MREIKFRAWDKISKLMIQFDTPTRCIEYGMLAWESSEFPGIGNLPGSYEYLMDDTEEGEEDPYIVMQFTGLHDKNGKEIYEGDVVAPEHESSGRAVVEWREECASFETHWQDGHFDHNCGTWEFLEVIGNIYENPELVKP